MTKTTAAGLALGAALLLVVGACVTTGPGGKSSLVIVSTSEEVGMGKEMDAEIRKTETMLPDTAWNRYLAEVGQRIVNVCDRKDLEYHYAVVESPQINAFAAPGGFVYFYTGILREMDNEAQMAAVMAHELSHVVARHGVKKLQTILGASVILQIALGGSSDLTQQAVSIVFGLALSGYGRSMELEADRYGVIYMTRAGYNPEGAIEMFQKLADLSNRGQPNVFEKLTSSHPETQERIAKIREQIAALPADAEQLGFYRERYTQMREQLPPPKE